MNLLLTDDSPADVCLVSAILDRLRPDIAIDVARNGIEALERLGLGRHRSLVPGRREYGLVLLDINMPVMNGMEMLTALQGCPHPPIVVMTGGLDICRSGKAVQLGAEDCYEKPCDLAECESLLREIADRWLPLTS